MKRIVAYGSLLDSVSLASTIQRKPKMEVVTLDGWQRVFNAPGKEATFCNIRQEKNSSIDVAVFSVGPMELRCLRHREWGGFPVEVLPNTWAFVWCIKLSDRLPVLQEYLDVCLKGAAEQGINFWKGTVPPREISDRGTYSEIYRPFDEWAQWDMHMLIEAKRKKNERRRDTRRSRAADSNSSTVRLQS